MTNFYIENIRRIARVEENKKTDDAGRDSRPSILQTTKPFPAIPSDDGGGGGLVSPVTFEVLTYDDTLDVVVEANNGDFTHKTAKTARITDAAGTVIDIDTIIYPAAP